MRRLLRARPITAVMMVGLLASAAAGSVAAEPAAAHGSTRRPASRYYACRFESPGNPMCAAAWSANAQSLYDWMEVNIGDAGGRHQELIPDGKLCSANRSKYAAFDAPGDWPVTNLQPDAAGLVDIAYTSTAPHATAYFRFYLTREGFDGRSDSLSWADLQLQHDSGPLAASPESRFQVRLPPRSAPAILYVVWQRNDSTEAFYACSDVTVGATAAPGVAAPPVTSAGRPTPVPSPATVAPPAPPAAAAVPPPTSTLPTSPSASVTVSPADPVELAPVSSATVESPPTVTAPSAGTVLPATAAPSAVASTSAVPAAVVTAAPEHTGIAKPAGRSTRVLWPATAVLAVAGLVGLTCLLVPAVHRLPGRVRDQRLRRRHRRTRAVW